MVNEHLLPLFSYPPFDVALHDGKAIITYDGGHTCFCAYPSTATEPLFLAGMVAETMLRAIPQIEVLVPTQLVEFDAAAVVEALGQHLWAQVKPIKVDIDQSIYGEFLYAYRREQRYLYFENTPLVQPALAHERVVRAFKIGVPLSEAWRNIVRVHSQFTAGLLFGYLYNVVGIKE